MSGTSCLHPIVSFLIRLCHVLCPAVCVLLLLLQSCLLDYYLVFYNNLLWCLWAIGDVIVATVFITSLIISFRLRGPLCSRIEEKTGRRYKGGQQTLCEITLAVSWLLFSAVISAKIGILFGDDQFIVSRIKASSILNGNTLRTSLCLSSIIFFTLLVAHRDALGSIERKDETPSDTDRFNDRSDFMKSLSSTVAFDLLDSVQFLDVLYVYESRTLLSYELQTSVVAFTCINFILPTALLLALLVRSEVWLRRLPYLTQVVYILVVNVPMFVIRVIIWHYDQKEVSVFIVKNILEIGKAIYDMIEIHAKNSTKSDQQRPSTSRQAGGGGGQTEMNTFREYAETEESRRQNDVH